MWYSLFYIEITSPRAYNILALDEVEDECAHPPFFHGSFLYGYVPLTLSPCISHYFRRSFSINFNIICKIHRSFTSSSRSKSLSKYFINIPFLKPPWCNITIMWDTSYFFFTFYISKKYNTIFKYTTYVIFFILYWKNFTKSI